MPNRTIRTGVPPEVYEVLESEAALRGLTLGAYVRSILSDYAKTYGATPSTPTAEQWEHLRSWSMEHPDALAALRSDAAGRGRSAKYAYAIDHLGYSPE